MISQFREDAAHIDLFLYTHVKAHPEHQCKAVGALHKPLVEEFQKKVKSVSVLSGNCNMGARVQMPDVTSFGMRTWTLWSTRLCLKPPNIHIYTAQNKQHQVFKAPTYEIEVNSET